MSTRRARVLAAYATVKLLDPISGKWTVAGYYQGAILPDHADPENVASLVRREYAEWLDSGETKSVTKQEAEAGKVDEEVAKQRMEEAEAAAKADSGADDQAADKPASKVQAVKPAGKA